MKSLTLSKIRFEIPKIETVLQIRWLFLVFLLLWAFSRSPPLISSMDDLQKSDSGLWKEEFIWSHLLSNMKRQIQNPSCSNRLRGAHLILWLLMLIQGKRSSVPTVTSCLKQGGDFMFSFTLCVTVWASKWTDTKRKVKICTNWKQSSYCCRTEGESRPNG